MHEGHPQEGS